MPVLVYELLDSKNLKIQGRWENGSWTLDHKNFSNIEKKYESFEEQLLDRFDGPIYFAVKEVNVESRLKEIKSDGISEASHDQAMGDFMRQKMVAVEDYKKGNIKKDDYKEEDWQKILEWVEKYG